MKNYYCLLRIINIIGCISFQFAFALDLRTLKTSREVKMSTLDSIGQDISRALQGNYQPLRWKDSYGVGGSGATANTVLAPNGEEFFVKRGGLASFQMLQAEFAGIQEIHTTHTIRVPKPICLGTNDYESYVVFEKVNTGGRGQPKVMAERLAAMHSTFAQNQMFGWKMDNTIGATYQPNSYSVSWSEFWDRNRLGHMLTLAKRDGANFPMEQELRNKVRYILSNHDCKPSLVHGDLWSGNQGFDRHGEPIIFDPAVYVSTCNSCQLAHSPANLLVANKFYSMVTVRWTLR